MFDQLAFLVGTAAAAWLAVIIGIQGFHSPWAPVWVIPIWAITAYFVLPRLHRLLSDLYVPDYFFGRTRTADGLLGDPVNLGVDGSAEQLDHVMTKAGWHRADEITAASSWRIIMSTLTRRSYPTAPVSSLMLFGRRHDIAYEQEVAGNPKQRHHVRFWHCPPGWLLPGGASTDWLGAGTYDMDVRLSFFTLQVTHRINEDTDVERDYVVSSIQQTNQGVTLRTLRNFTTGYHARNGGGDRFITDGDLPIIDVSAVDAPPRTVPNVPGEASATEMIERAPLATAVAAALVVLVSAIQLIDFVVAGDAAELVADGSGSDRVLIALAIGAFCVFKLSQLVMSWLALRGGRRSRAALMVLLTLEISLVAADYLDGSAALGLDWTLFTASVQCLTLLALSSESSGAWARRTRKAGSAARE
ncbi:hypothetical protein GCM10009785_21920 [Brooklawnia cerclae]|uniref:LssY C-terminal domain-containing protein n=1 Tax=Brooklawnia cerclae TaxID=349934 RepID=UPI001FB958AF|nr:LssY C-terminal domain-containing protein [Brooklawnia cerclae]